MSTLTFHYHHMMAWPNLPEDYDTAYDSAWVTLPNSIYDPVAGHKVFASYFDELQRADELGWDSVIIPEHHQTAAATIPSPNLMAAVLTQRVRRARIGVVGNALPLHRDPLRVAEEIAVLDVISGGRIISGFVRAIGMEYFNSGVNPTISRELMNEAHDLIIQAWTRPGPFAYEGKHFNYRYVNIWPRPLQQPHPPVWLPGSFSSETIDTAARHRYPYMTVFMTTELREMAYKLYRQYAEQRYGYEPDPSQLAFCAPIFIGDTEEQALRTAQPYVEWLFDKTFFKVKPEFVSPPGYLSDGTVMQMLKSGALAQLMKPRSFRELVQSGTVIVGTAEAVAEQLAYHADELRAGKIVNITRIGPMSDQLVAEQQERLAKDVMPKFRPAGSTPEVGAQAAAAATHG